MQAIAWFLVRMPKKHDISATDAEPFVWLKTASADDLAALDCAFFKCEILL